MNLFWHNSNVVNYIIKKLPLEKRINAISISAIFLFLILGVLTYLYANKTINEFTIFSKYSKQAQLDLAFAKNVLKLELASFRYIDAGHEFAAKKVYRIYDEMKKQLDFYESNQLIKLRKKKIEHLLYNYIISFKKVQKQHTLKSNLINKQFRDISFNIQNLIEKYLYLLGNEQDTKKIKMVELQKNILLINNSAFRYFDTLDSQYVKDAKDAILMAKNILNHQSLIEQNEKRKYIITILLSDMKIYESIFLEAVQRTRGYLYLVNVVMAADSYEMRYQAKNIANILNEDMKNTEEGILHNIKSSLSSLNVMAILFLLFIIVISYFIQLSIVSPIRSLTKIFSKLTDGSKERIDVETPHKDAISDLVYAAKTFRTKNIEIHALLDDYKELNETLELKVKNRTKELELLSSTDALTKMYNRMYIDNALDDEIKRCERYKSDFSIIMLDIDYFKNVNDNYGHQIGDTVLIEFSNILNNLTRETDIVGRWGGEEFLILCPQTDKPSVLRLAEKLRENIETYSFSIVNKKTASFGVATYIDKDNSDSIVERADKALYLSKKTGRNKVQVL